jgi:hypothetical protein
MSAMRRAAEESQLVAKVAPSAQEVRKQWAVSPACSPPTCCFNENLGPIYLKLEGWIHDISKQFIMYVSRTILY